MIIRMLLNPPSSIVDYSDFEAPNKLSLEPIPELREVVLSVCWETIPREMKFAGKVDFNTLLSGVLLPFFQKRTRLLKRNILFAVNKVHFKVLSCDSEWGKVTPQTLIFCYKYLQKRVIKID